ncbi:MAG: universal stress protein [Pseudomonadota bacterium]
MLDLAADLAGRLGARRVIGIAACQPLQIYGGPEAYVPQDLIDRDTAQMEGDLKSAEERFRARLGKAAAVEWRSTVTNRGLADYIAYQARAADLLITGSEEGGTVLDTSRRVSLADLVLKAGRPLLIAATNVRSLDVKSVVVAWKDSPEARRAVADALPLLKLAERVTVVQIAAKDEIDDARACTADVAAWLGNHGITAKARSDAEIGDDAEQLAAIAAELGAGLLVGGAYGHTRLREWVLGGVTRDLLLRPAACSLLSH